MIHLIFFLECYSLITLLHYWIIKLLFFRVNFQLNSEHCPNLLCEFIEMWNYKLSLKCIK